jgi:hypothetical protein
MTEPIRIRVRTNFAVNSKSISHEQTVEIDAPVVYGTGSDGGAKMLVDCGDGTFEDWDCTYNRVLREAREVAAQELERRKAQFLAPVVA